MLVVVQTYPAHFYQTLLCLHSIQKHVQDLDDLILIIDDRSPLCWESYVQDCKDTYSGAFDRIIQTSSIKGLRFLQKYPWLRQQTVKLLLDKIVDEPSWLFIDGDIQLISPPPTDSIPMQMIEFVGVPLDQRDPVPGEMSSQILFYIRYMLEIEFCGFWDNDNPDKMITASHPPVHVMRAEVLNQLRTHIESRFNQPLEIVHKNIAMDTRMAASEWDLIECFRQAIMGESSNWYQGETFCTTTWSSDKELGRPWFEQAGIKIDEKIWQSLPDKKYF